MCHEVQDNRIAKSVRCHVVHTLHQGVLYFHSVAGFHDKRLHVVPFRPNRRPDGLSSATSGGTHKPATRIFLCVFYQNLTKNVGNGGRVLFTCLK
jgi:hypothetical protein